jgi:preprotein translocase subunit SecY
VDGRADHEARDRQRHLDLIFASILATRRRGINAWVERRADDEALLPDPVGRVVAAVVFVQEGQRRSRSVRDAHGRPADDAAAGSTYMPLRVNMAGVIPIIFAAAMLAFPPTIAQFFRRRRASINHFQPLQASYLAIEAFCSSSSRTSTPRSSSTRSTRPTTAQVRRLHPRIRPGPPTAQYLDRVLSG